MPSIVKYQRVIADDTTYQLAEPDYASGADRCIEIATLGGVTYVAVPATVKLPAQPKQIKVSLATLTAALRVELKSASPHVRLIDKRVVERIRAKYSIDDEIKHIWIGAGPDVDAYRTHVATQIAWGATEKMKLGL